MNKRGEKLLSIWMIFIIVLVSIVLIGAVNWFYSIEIDVRGDQAVILSERVGSCLNSASIEEILKDDFDLASYCDLKEEQFGEDLYLFVSVSDSNGEKIREDIFYGNKDLETQCGIKELGVKAENFASCSKTKELLLGGEEVTIFTGSNKEGERLV